MLYLIDQKTKKKVAQGTDIRKIQMLKDVLWATQPCFILTVLVGGL